MTNVFPKKLDGTPETNLKSYTNSSVFSQTDSTGGNAKFLLKISNSFHCSKMAIYNNYWLMIARILVVCVLGCLQTCINQK